MVPVELAVSGPRGVATLLDEERHKVCLIDVEEDDSAEDSDNESKAQSDTEAAAENGEDMETEE